MSHYVVATVGLILVASAANATEVRLRSSAGCAAAMVRLGDIAEILGDDPRAAAALAEIPLCPAPAAGSTRVLAQNEVRQLLGLSGVEQKAAIVTGSEAVTIVYETRGESSSPFKWPMVAAGVRQAVFEADTDNIRKQPHTRSLSKPVAAAADSQESTAQPVVARGTTVTVHARTAGVRITTSGKALDAGASGEAITVELADTRQRVLARVTGPQDVEVAASGGSAAAFTR